MQLASRCWRLGSSAARPVARRGSYKSRATRASFYTGVSARDSKKALSHEEMTSPVSAESMKHLEIPSDLMQEATAFRQEIEALEMEESKVVMVDTVQSIATQVGLLQRAAAHLKKDVRDVSALDVATYRLHEHEEFVSKVELDKVVLFSHEAELENFRAGVKTIASRYDDGKLPADIKKALDAAEAVLVERAANQTILEVPVSEEVYQHTQQNLFPSFAKKGITPQEYLDFVGGSDGLIDPVTFHVRDLLMQLEKAGAKEKTGLLTKLEQSIVAYEDALPEEYVGDERQALYNLTVAQGAAEESMGTKLGRRVVLGDLNPERRLLRSLEVSHPILSMDQTYYVHGDVSNVKEATAQIMKDEAPAIEFTARADFNPPTGYREATTDFLKLEPEAHAYMQREALNFPMWEGEEAATAINSAELIVEMKLFKLFNYMYPMLADSHDAQKLFMEMYDVSPGEPTLEWALSYPTKEHTFFPEHPLWVHVFEDDEDVAPVVWPEYTPVSVEGMAEVASARNGENATIRFLPHSKEQVALDAHYNHVFSQLPVEKRFVVPKEQILASIASLSAADKQKAEAAWGSLSVTQKQLARQAWAFEASPLLPAQNFVKSQEAIAKLEQRALSQKL